jgi:ribonuclease J
VHGEARHLQEHAKLALACQIPQALIIGNGAIVTLSGKQADVVGEVPTGRLALHGKNLISTRSTLLRDMSRTLDSGFVVVSLCVDENGELLDDPKFSTIGTLEGAAQKALTAELGDALQEEIDSLPPARRRNDDAIVEIVKKTMRKMIQVECGKRPWVDVHLYRLEEEELV